MGVIISERKDKKYYYKQEADKLRRQASEMEKNEDYAEAKRLRELADESDKTARSLDNEMKKFKR